MSTLRISGLASGMDVDSMVTKLMTAERIPLDKLKQKKQVLEWQRDDYRAMNTLLLNFRTELMNMKLTTSYRARTTTSTNETQVTATATSAASQASYSISNVTQLASAATLKNGGTISANPASKIDVNKGLFDSKTSYSDQTLLWSKGSVESETITVTTAGSSQSLSLGSGITLQDIDSMNVKVNGVAYDVVTTTPVDGLAANQVLVETDGALTFGTSIAANSSIKVDYFANRKVETFNPTTNTNDFQLMKGSIPDEAYNPADPSFTINNGEYTMDNTTIDSNNPTRRNLIKGGSAVGYIDISTGKIHFDTAIPSGTQLKVEYKQNYTTFSVSSNTSEGLVEEHFAVQGSDTLNQVISRVNGSDAGVTMFYDSFSDRMTMTRKETGNFNTSGTEIQTSGDFLNKTLKFGIGSSETGGENAIFTINGLDTERSSNTFEMNGVTFTLKQTFTTGKVDIAINNDSNAVFDNIKAFVDKYNELIDKIQSKVSENYYRDYPPLTDDQKEQLSDTQQEQWTEKAKSGLLRRDSILQGALDTMRGNFYAPVTNSQVNPVYNQLASIGITTTSNYLEGGKLQIDEAKLKEAIQADPNSVENLFRGTGNTSAEQGVIQRLYDSVSKTMDSLKEKAGNSFSTNKQFALGRLLDSVGTQITRFEDRMMQVEDRYYRQFTAMEKAIQKANSQSTYLMQQFSSGQ